MCYVDVIRVILNAWRITKAVSSRETDGLPSEASHSLIGLIYVSECLRVHQK